MTDFPDTVTNDMQLEDASTPYYLISLASNERHANMSLNGRCLHVALDPETMPGIRPWENMQNL
jgi:hypothetical protein